MTDRYLTDDEKAAEVARWLAYRDSPEAQLPAHLRDTPADYGYPDPSIFALTDALNALDGVLTWQSCAGHRRPGEDGDAVQSGRLWLRLSEPLMATFTRDAYRVLACPTIEYAGRIFHTDLGDVAELIFEGDNTGRLAESGVAIVGFFSGLTEAAHREHPP